MSGESKAPGELAQTLDRGLRVLEFLGKAAEGFTATEVAQHIGVHRSIAARLLATLTYRGFASKMTDGRYVIGTGVFRLARMVARDLMSVAQPMLRDATDRIVATSVLHIADGDEVVTLLSIEPPTASFRVGMRVGARGPLDLAAHGLAILAGREYIEGERAEVTEARRLGYSMTTGEVVPGYTGISAPVRVSGQVDASVGLVVPESRASEQEKLAAEVLELAEALSLAAG